MPMYPVTEVDAILRKARELRAEETHRLARALVTRIARLFQRTSPSRSH